MWTLTVTTAAWDDIENAALWYRKMSEGLAARFAATVAQTLLRISSQPLLYPCVKGDMRRVLLPGRFPYSLFFTAEDRRVLVFACFHNRRNPAVWQQRREEK